MSRMKHNSNSRRHALIGIVSVLGSTSVLPQKWVKPVINTVILPAHAQTSATTTMTPTTTVTPTTTTSPTTTTATPTTTAAPEPVVAVLNGVVDGPAGTTFTADASASTGPMGAMLSYTFSGSGNCTLVSQSGAMAEIMRGQFGMCTVSVTVTDGNTSDTASASATITPPLPPSDRRLKTDIQELTKTDNGYQLYRFKYLSDPDRIDYVGVMAQDIIGTFPDAVAISNDGFYAVDYAHLGLQMTTYKQWQDQGLESVQL